MKKIFGQRGQAAVEFTLVLPFFVLVLLSTIYLGMFIVDYVTLDNAANAAARHAALNTANNYDITTDDKTKIKETQLFITWYTVKNNSNLKSKIIYKSDKTTPDYVTVMIQATLNGDGKNKSIFEKILPDAYTVSKTAKIETTP